MAFVIVAIATTIVAGIPLVLAFDRHARGAALVGLSYLYGAGLVWATLFALSLMHVGWTAVTTTSVLVVLSAVMWAVVLLRRGAAPPPAAAVADEPPVTADGVRASAPGHFPSERSGVGRRLAAGETPALLVGNDDFVGDALSPPWHRQHGHGSRDGRDGADQHQCGSHDPAPLVAESSGDEQRDSRSEDRARSYDEHELRPRQDHILFHRSSPPSESASIFINRFRFGTPP